jgi:hypothetical protein
MVPATSSSNWSVQEQLFAIQQKHAADFQHQL